MTIYEKLGAKREAQVPNKRQMEWYGRERSIFFHFGMNTFTGKEWGDGSESPSLFNPTECDVDSWVEAISKAGFACAILTAKHHDGFCLWQTKYTEHSIKNSPYKNGKGDIVREFTDACKKYGVKAGIYLSPWDRHEPSWGTPDYNDYYANQLTELMSNYGEIWECWWDGAGSTEAVYDWARWAKAVRTLQPDAVIFGSLGATPWVDVRWVGNEKGVAGKPCYATIDEHSLVVENTAELNRGKLDGERFIPAEVDVSIRPGWFYHAEQDHMVRSPENLIDLWFTSVGSNAGLLLNLPPDRRGLVHENDVKSIKEFNSILNSTLSKNLACSARLFGEGMAEFGIENLLTDGKAYIPKNKNSTLEIVLDNAEEINTFMIGEMMEYGHRVTKIQAYAYVNGMKTLLFEREMIGYKLAERFDTVVTDRILLEIEAIAAPLLCDLGLYRFENKLIEAVKKNGKNLLEGESARVEYGEKEIDVNLGGIFPFNSVTVDGVGNNSYEFYVFNGTAFDLYKKGKCVNGKADIRLDIPVDNAYRFKLIFENEIPKDAKTEAKLT